MRESSRLFVAVEIGEAARRAVMAVAAAVAARLEAERGLRVSWVRPGNVHLTLRFLGQVAHVVAAALRGEMARVLVAEPFELTLASAGVFPPAGTPRVIWVGVQDRAGGFERVVPELDDRLARAGAVGGTTAFAPHVTIGRIRRAPRLGRTIRQAVEVVPVEPARWRVTRVTLYESRLSGAAPVYTPLASARLSGRFDSTATE